MRISGFSRSSKASMLVAVAAVTALGSAAHGQWVTSGTRTYVSSMNTRVGVGTSNPQAPIHVLSNTATPYASWFEHYADGATAVFGYQGGQNGDGKGMWGYTESPVGTGVLGQAANGSGMAVGVRGLSSSVGGFGGFFEGGRFGIFATHTQPGGYAAFLEGTTYISANLGIGTTNPFSKVHVYGFAAPAELRLETNAGMGNSALTFSDSTNRVPYVGMDFDEASDSLRLRTNIGASVLNTTAMAVKRTSGKVGFQTENPKARLQIGAENAAGGYRNWMSEGVYAEADSDGMYVGLKNEGGNRQDSIIAFGDDTSENLRFVFSPPGAPTLTAVTEVMRISGTQRVAIGTTNTTSSAHRLVVQGDNNASVWIKGTNGGASGGRINFGDLNSTDGVNGFVYLHEDTDDHLRIHATSGVQITASLSKPGGSFFIDHPTDPANKYLYHSFVESPDMMNIYNGNVTTDAQGYATITMPDYFEALNRDFRYQLTVVDDGDSASWVMVKVVAKIENREFTIRTSSPNVEVSWQVTGVRQDAWANAHRIPNDVEKEPENRGKYLYPELFGASKDQTIVNVTPPGYAERKAAAKAAEAARARE